MRSTIWPILILHLTSAPFYACLVLPLKQAISNGNIRRIAFRSDSRMDGVLAAEVISSSIPNRIKLMILKLVFTAKPTA